MKPARAIRFLVPAGLFARDATDFCQWVMPSTGAAARACATSALLSFIFAGSAQGIPCGDHAERKRGAADDEEDQQGAQAGNGQGSKKDKSPFNHARRYVFIPPNDPTDEWAMWHMGYEEIYDAAEENVTFIGVWLWTFDPTHSTSYLMSMVMADNAYLLDSQCAAAQAPTMRHKAYATEAEKHKRGGCGVNDLRTNFEGTVGMQHRRITNMESYVLCLKEHAGPSSVNATGEMYIDDFDDHMDCPMGRQALQGDKVHGLGSLHPAAIEFACNAKRVQGLKFGAVNLDGSPGDVHPKYYDPQSYWHGPNMEYFRLPPGPGGAGNSTNLWICASRDRRTIFDMPLPRPLQNAVLPGPDLMDLFLEVEAEWNQQAATTAAPAEPAEETAADVAAQVELPVDEVVLADARAQHAAAQQGGDDAEEEGEQAAAAGSGAVPMVVVEDARSEDGRAEGEQQDAAEQPGGARRVTQDAYNRFRSLVTKRDEKQRLADEAIRSTLRRYDSLSDGVASNLSSSDTIFSFNEKEGGYKVYTEKMCDRVARESNRAWSTIIKPWHAKKERDFEDRKCALEVEGAEEDDARWSAIEKEESVIATRFYKVKRDLVQYHLRSLWSCFHSARDRVTLPNGYKAMVDALEEYVKKNGSCASMAFSPRNDGKQIMASDRQVWHELQEWLGQIFGPDSRIEGRDRFLMDELYMQSFEMYADTTFVLLICSERGKGKSVRAMRMEKILPPGIVSWNAAASARAGMNGNMAPSNGTLIIYDEMTKDLTAPEVDERMEYWKQILTRRSFTIERTKCVKNQDGSDSHVTCEIITDHSVAVAIMTNHGPAFTPGKEEPSAGKFAMINRSIGLFARAETDKASSDSAFEQVLESPQVQARIEDFRLFTCLTAFAKLAMRKCPWIQPDMGFANQMWAQGDKMLQNEYQMPAPEPRRMTRRAENCQTMAIMEAVARVYMYKQTAVNFDAGKPLEGMTRAKEFEIGDLWDVIRVASVPTRSVIKECFVKSFPYSISTSPNGINVLSSICEYIGLGLSKFFRKIPTDTVESLVGMDTSQSLESYMDTDGADTEELQKLGKHLTESRRLRAEWRAKAFGAGVADKMALEGIKAVLKGENDATHKRYANALMPNYRQAALNYAPMHVLKWSMGQLVDTAEEPFTGSLKFKQIPSQGGAQLYDHAWIVVKEPHGDDMNFRSLATDLSKIPNCPVALFDYHNAGTADTMLMLETPEAQRLCPEMPKTRVCENAANAFVDEKNARVSKESKQCNLRSYIGRAAHMGDLVDCRLDDDPMHYSTSKVHASLDIITNRGRLPALQPYTSPRIAFCAPLRRMEGSGIEINAVTAYEHTAMIMEASINCATIPGLKGRQEKFAKNRTGPEGLKARSYGASNASTSDNTMTKLLPFCNDLAQCNWARDFGARFYVPTRDDDLASFNALVKEEGLGTNIESVDLPQATLSCQGFADGTHTQSTGDRPLIRLLGIDMPSTNTVPEIEVSTVSPIMTLSDDDLYNQVATALGKEPSSGDIAAYRRDLVGNGYMHDVKGDLNSYTTWRNHLAASMTSRGNADPEDDTGMESLLDAEMMLWCRLVEKRAAKEGTVESKYGIFTTKPMTYAGEERAKAAGIVRITERAQKKTSRPEPRRSGANIASKKFKRSEAPAAAAEGCGGSCSGANAQKHPGPGLHDARDDED